MLGVQQGKITGFMREFSEEVDAEFIPLRTIATWEAEETMLRAVPERDVLVSEDSQRK
jgi:hypothetical protein